MSYLSNLWRPAMMFAVFSAACFERRVEEGRDPVQCGDATDNDADGEVDCDDAGCAAASMCIDAGSDTVVCPCEDPACASSEACLGAADDSGSTESPPFDDGVLTPGEGLDHPTLGTLRYVPPGVFTMGCLAGRDDVAGGCFALESPKHTVILTRSFWMMESEMTQAAWGALGLNNPSYFQDDRRPVEWVTWWEAVAAANVASTRDGYESCYMLTGCTGEVGVDWSCAQAVVDTACDGWRLPTEAEWEWAARAGGDQAYAGSDDVGDVAWYGYYSGTGTSGAETHTVCGLQRNGYGLCDMTGNVWEWTTDGYADYAAYEVTDPVGGPPNPALRVSRGGAWGDDARASRVAFRSRMEDNNRNGDLGFRLIRVVR